MDYANSNAGGDRVTRVDLNIGFDDLLDKVGGDTEFLQERFDIFLADSAGLLNEIKANIANGDHEALSRTAHKLKGSIANFVPSGPVFEAAKSLEFMGKDNNLDSAQDGFQDLTEHLDNLHSTIREYGDNLK